MRSAVLLALFGLAIASSQWPTRHHVSEQYFRAGREYRYRFDGLVSAGIPVPGEQSSATRLQTLVHIQPEDDRYVRLQLVDPSFANDQTEYSKIVAYGKIDTVPVKEEYERALRLPIRFSYRNGLVSDIEFSHEEQTWSANIKRAVVNMLQINLIKKGINEKIQQSEWEQDQENDFFVATERTIEGECEVTYTKLQRSEQQQQWTKAINFEKCSIRPEVTYGRRYSEKCEECEKTLSDEKLSSTVMTYNVSGTPEQYLIHSVELQSQHSMAPLSEEQQLIVVRVINKMELVYAGKIAKEIPAVRGERKETLIYNPEWELAEEKFAMTGDEKYLRRIPFWGNRVEMIQQQISKLSKQIEDGVELETTHLVARLVKLIRLATEEELNTIRRHVSEKNEKVQALYIDVLALAGTKNTIYQLFEKMNTKEISPVKAAQLFKILAELRTPSKPIMDMFWRFCDSTRSSVVRQSCWLSYGSVLNGVCGDHADKFASIYETKKMCSRSEKEEYVHQIVEKINQAETRYEKILFVKTLANSAVDVSVPHLEKIIMNQQVEKAVRVQAVDALRRLRRVMPKKIQNVLVPIYKSYKETPEIRMTALNVLLQTQPEQGVLDMIVRGIENERNQQVRVFTYTSLKTLSETTNPCEKTFAIRIAQALTTLPEQEVAILDSRLKTISSYNGIMGTNWNFATLFTNESVLPKEISASLETVFGGQWNKYLAQVGLMQNNFDKLISELLKTVEKSGLENIIVRGKRSVISRPTELLRSLFESLKINHRRVNTEEPRAMLYFRYKDMDFAFVPMNIDTMPEMIRRVLREGQLDISELEKILTGRFGLTGAAFFHESIRTLPTALGMPVVFSAKNPTVAALHGSVKFDLEPKNSDRVNGLRVRIVAKPQVAWTHVTKVEIMCPVVSSGMKLLHGGRVNTPVDTEIEINWEKKLTIKNTFKTPVENRHLVHITSRPVVFYRQWRKEQYPEAKETTVQLRNVEKNEFERVFERNGLKVIVSGQYTDDLFYGENVIDVVVEPKEDIPKEVISHLTLQTFEDIEMEKPSMFHNFFEKNAELFNTESSEYKEESESDRRRAFHNYVKQLKTDKAYRHRMLLKMETTPKTEEVEMGIRCECDEHMRFCRVKMDMKIPTEEERKPWEIRLTAESLYPEMPTSFKKMFNQPHREYVGAIQASWGSEEKNDVLLRIQGEQSRAQKKWMRRVDREQNGLTETEKLYNAAKLNQYKVLVDYELTPKNQMYLENGMSLVQVWKMWKTTVEPSKEVIRNHMKLQFTTDMEMTWNVTAWTSEMTIMIQDLELPYYMAVIPSTNIRKTYGGIRSVKHVAKLIEKESRPECVVKSKEIKTFDGTFFKAPLTTCYSVLSKDCSSQEPEFAVLMKKITPQGEKSLKVISPEYEIVMEKSEGEMILRVNGKQVEDEEQWEQYGVTKEGEYYKIDIENIVCHFDGFHAKVKLSPLYKNKQCGICGHFDGERDNEFRRADNEETEDIEEFHRSYLIKDSECRVEEEQLSKKTNYKRLDEETSSSEEHYDDDTREPVLRHRLVERGQKVCFSVKSVKTCPKNTREEKFDEESVSFKCLRRSEPLAQRLLRSYRQQEIIVDELSEYEVVFEKEIRIPRMCTVY